MVTAKKLCTICKNKAEQLLQPKEKVLGKELSKVIQKICDNERVELPEALVMCTDCTVALLQAERVLTRLRQALALSKPDKKRRVKPQSVPTLDSSDNEDSVDATMNGSSKATRPAADAGQCTTTTSSAMLHWQFKCKLCLFETEKPKIFKTHLKSNHGEQIPRIYKCPYCSESYQRANGIHNHIAYVHENRPKPKRTRRKSLTDDTSNTANVNLDATLDDTTADAAEKANSSNTLELAQLASSTPMTTYTFKCADCDYKCVNPKLYKRHRLQKHNDDDLRIYKCHLCEHAYQRVYALQNHIAYVHEQKPRPTPQRRKSVPPDFEHNSLKDDASMMALSQIKVEATEQDVELQQCEQCGYETTDKSMLRKHLVLVHQIDSIASVQQNEEQVADGSEDAQPAQDADDYLFQKPKNKTRDADQSETNWSFRCEHCPYITIKKKHYRKHLRLEHDIENAEIYKCNDCGETYARQNLLQAHAAFAHGRDLFNSNADSMPSDSSVDHGATPAKAKRQLFNEADALTRGSELYNSNANSMPSNSSSQRGATPAKTKKRKLSNGRSSELSNSNADLMPSDSSMDHGATPTKSKKRNVYNEAEAEAADDVLQPNDNSLRTDSIIDLTALPKKKRKLSKHEVCVVCGKAYSTLEKLRVHMDKNHGGDKIKRCNNCDAQFQSEAKYDAHVFSEKCLDSKLQCQFAGCDKRFNKASKLQQHMHLKHSAILNNYDEDFD